MTNNLGTHDAKNRVPVPSARDSQPLLFCRKPHPLFVPYRLRMFVLSSLSSFGFLWLWSGWGAASNISNVSSSRALGLGFLARVFGVLRLARFPTVSLFVFLVPPHLFVRRGGLFFVL